MFLIGMWTTGAHAQTITIGTGTTTTTGNGTPIYRSSSTSSFHHSKSIQLLTAAQLSGAGLTAGANITGYGYNKQNNGQPAGANGWTINVYLKNSSATTLASGTSWSTMISGAVLGYTATITSSNMPSATGYWVWPISGFTYTGGAIECYIEWFPATAMASPYTTNSFTWQYTTSGNQAMGTSSSTAIPSSQSSWTTQARFYNTQIDYTTGPCTGTPSPGNTTTSASPVCPSATFSLGLQNPTTGSGVTYQWQSSPDNITYTNISGATNAAYSLTQSADTWYQCIVTCTNSGQTTTSTPLQVTTNPFYNCYCASGATSTADEEIFGVTVGSMSNSSTCTTTACGTGSVNSNYSNYKGCVTGPTVSQGDNVPFSLDLGYCGSFAYSNMAAIYIDYNQNGSFADAGEQVYTKPYAAGALPSLVVTGSFIVPFTALTGTTGMRIVYVESSSISSCGTFSWGETEDYNITITASTNCSGTPAPGNTLADQTSVCGGQTINLTLQNSVTGSGVTYDWQSSPDGVTWTSTGGTNPFYSTTQNSATWYQCVVTCTNSGQSATSTAVQVLQNPFMSCYCASGATSTADEEIFGVTVGSMSNSSTCSTIGCGTGSGVGYANYKGCLTGPTVFLGDLVPFSLTLGYCGSYAYSNTAAIYIDYNQNGSFADAGETVYTKPYGSGTVPSWVVSGNFTVPMTATTGTTVMRIVYVESSTISPCGTFSWGETEDYEINIIAPTPCSGTPAPGNTLSDQTTACSNTTINLSLQNIVAALGITYDWQSSPDGVTWTSTGGTQPFYSTTQFTATWYQCVVTCSNSGLSGTSTPVQVTMSPFYNCYCTSGLGGSCSINSLSSVAIATTTLNNVTGGCTGTYNSFPASGNTTASLVPGVPYTMTAGCISGSNTQVAIWIDYNQNGIYETTEYTLINGNIPSGGTGPGSFTIPLTALSGSTGMRVRSDWQGTTAWTSADACTNRTWGETEDYTITVLVPNSCTGTPATSVTTASVASVCPGGSVNLATNPFYTDGGLTFDWQSSTDGITYSSTGVTTQNYNVTGFSVTTWYQCVVTCTNSGLSTTSTPVQVTLNPFYNCYCTANLHSFSTPCIDEIDLNTLSNNTAAAGCALPAYSYQSATTTVLKGSTYTFTRTASGTGVWTGLWIDYNHSGTFDASEYIQVSSTSTATLVNSISLTIPLTALDGNTGMRIRQRTVNMTATDACTQNFGSGETEDYTINIQTPAPCSGTPAAGNTVSSAPSVCTSVAFNLSISTSYNLAGITYQWQSSTDGITYTNTSGTLPTYSATQSVATWYQCIVTCTNSGLSITTTPVQVTMSPFFNCYCASSATSTADEEIFGVTVGSMTNTSTCTTTACGAGSTNQMYSNYHGCVTPATIIQGTSVPFSLDLGYCGATAYSNTAAIYIDFNQNGLFTDAGETVYTKPYGAGVVPSSVYTGNFTVPMTAVPGTTGMRIVYVESSVVNPCGTYSWGETEDYDIVIAAAAACSGTPAATISGPSNTCAGVPFNLNAGPVGFSGLSYLFQVSTNGGVTWTDLGIASANSIYTISSQTVTSQYQVIVTCSNSSSSDTSAVITVTQNLPSACYCVPTTTGATTYNIINFTTTGGLANINNSSTGTANYENFSAMTATVNPGSSFNYSIDVAGGSNYGRAIWIDFNEDGVFQSTEQVVSSTSYVYPPLTGSISIPLSVTSGTKRMRILASYTPSNPSNACANSGLGQYEDYSLNIMPPVCIFAPTYPADAASGCPDVITNTVPLSWPALSGATGYDVYFGTTNPPTTLVSNNQPGLTFNADVSGGAPIYYWMIVPQISGGGTSCNVWSFTVSPAPVPVASSGGDVCSGNDIFLSSDNVAMGQLTGNTYSWTGPNGFNSTLQNPSISSPSAAYSGTYSVIVTNQYGCTAGASTSLSVNPNPTLTIDSVQNVSCLGGSDGIIYVSASGGLAPYSYTSDFINFNTNGIMNNLPTGASIVYAADGNACQAQIVGNLTAISTAPPSQSVVVTPTIIGMPAYACPGTTANLSIPAVPGATKYIWDGPFGTFFNGNPMNQSPYTTTTPSVQITFSSSTTSFVNVGVQAANGCGASLRKIQKVRYQISTPKEITGATTMCASTNGTYTIAPVTDATSYQWMITGNATVVLMASAVVFFFYSWNGGTLCSSQDTIYCYSV